MARALQTASLTPILLRQPPWLLMAKSEGNEANDSNSGVSTQDISCQALFDNLSCSVQPWRRSTLFRPHTSSSFQKACISFFATPYSPPNHPVFPAIASSIAGGPQINTFVPLASPQPPAFARVIASLSDSLLT